MQVNNTHNHPHEKLLIETMLVESEELENASKRPTIITSQTLCTSIANRLHTEAKYSLTASPVTITSRLQRRRSKATTYPILPKSLQQLEEVFPEWLTTTSDEKGFLIHCGAIKAGSKVWAYTFASPVGLKQIAMANVTTFDGTFKAAPVPFLQIFIGNVVTKEMRALPVLWALLTNKSIEAYKLGVFKSLK